MFANMLSPTTLYHYVSLLAGSLNLRFFVGFLSTAAVGFPPLFNLTASRVATLFWPTTLPIAAFRLRVVFGFLPACAHRP